MLNLGFAATNPCHLYALSQAVADLEPEVTFYMGYPRWRLQPPYPNHLRTHSFRTVVTYSLLRLPERLRPKQKTLFQWQDQHFDRWVACHLETHDFIHAMPGQALETFRRARQTGIRTVLNHATGPSRYLIEIMNAEYRRVGMNLTAATRYDDLYLATEQKEYELADFHCAASTLVRDQLLEQGIPSEKIWVVPYGASPTIFYPPPDPAKERFSILFAGQVTLRKGITTLLQALSLCRDSDWTVDFYGFVSSDVKRDISGYQGNIPLRFHGPVSQAELARAIRRSSVLVLPSLEEGFGLVVPQGLACGVPCIVSDRVGAKDLIQPGVNGSIFPVRDHVSLLAELRDWSVRKSVIIGEYSWDEPARRLVRYSAAALRPEDRRGLSLVQKSYQKPAPGNEDQIGNQPSPRIGPPRV